MSRWCEIVNWIPDNSIQTVADNKSGNWSSEDIQNAVDADDADVTQLN